MSVHNPLLRSAQILPIVFLLLVTVVGCVEYPEDAYGEISMDEWCDGDTDMAWTGCWKEIYQIDCQSGEDFETDQQIGEFRLRADGIYSITRHPFEHWVDYSGTYTVSETDGSMAFSRLDTSGFDGEGSYRFRENGDLVLSDVWFGIFDDCPDTESGCTASACGYVFR